MGLCIVGEHCQFVSILVFVWMVDEFKLGTLHNKFFQPIPPPPQLLMGQSLCEQT